jgi:hypothetical protein
MTLLVPTLKWVRSLQKDCSERNGRIAPFT